MAPMRTGTQMSCSSIDRLVCDDDAIVAVRIVSQAAILTIEDRRQLVFASVDNQALHLLALAKFASLPLHLPLLKLQRQWLDVSAEPAQI